MNEDSRMYFFTDILMLSIVTYSMFNDETIYATKNKSPIVVFDDVGIILRLTSLTVDTMISMIRKKSYGLMILHNRHNFLINVTC